MRIALGGKVETYDYNLICFITTWI